MNEIQPSVSIPEGEGFAISTFILQNYAGLTFSEAYAYLWVEHFRRGRSTLGKSRQAVYSLIKNAKRKIGSCGIPVLEMIGPYVRTADFLWVG